MPLKFKYSIAAVSISLACALTFFACQRDESKGEATDVQSKTYAIEQQTLSDSIPQVVTDTSVEKVELTECEKLLQEANSIFEGYNNEDNARRFYEKNNPAYTHDTTLLDSLSRESLTRYRAIIRHCSRTELTTHFYENVSGYDTVYISMMAYSRLATMAHMKGNYREAVSLLDTILSIYPDREIYLPFTFRTGPLHGLIKLEKARIYQERLNSTDSSLSLYQDVMKRYNNQELFVFEGSTPIAWQAFESFSAMLKRMNIDNNFRATQYQLAYNQTSSEIVKLQAATRLAELLFEANKYSEGVKKLRDNIKLYPNVGYSNHYVEFYFTEEVVERIFKALYYEKNDKIEAIKILDEIYKENEEANKTIALVAAYYKSRIPDLDNDPPSTVIQSYEALQVQLKPHKQSSSKVYEFSDLVDQRLLDIKSYPVTPVEIVVDPVNLYSRADSSSNATKFGVDEVGTGKIQYRSEVNKNWYKVKFGDKLYAWVHHTAFNVIEGPFFSKREKYASWPVHMGNPDGTRFVQGSRISTPRVLRAYENVCSSEILFSDINNDNIPELIIDSQIDPRTGKVEMVCIDGTVPEELWRIPREQTYCDFFSKSTIKDDILYRGGGAYNVKNGKPLGYPSGSGSYAVPTKKQVFWVWNNNLYVIDSTDKHSAWATKSFPNDTSQLRLFGGHMGVITDDKIIGIKYVKNGFEIRCLDIRRQKKTWITTQRTGTGVSSTAILNNKLIVCSTNGALDGTSQGGFSLLTIYDMTVGKILLNRKLEASGAAIMVKDKLIIVSIQKVYCYDPLSGDLLWKSIGGPIETYRSSTSKKYSVCAVGNTLYLGSTDGNLYCFDLNTGTQIWKYNLGRSIQGAISAAGNVLAVKTDNDILYIIGE